MRITDEEHNVVVGRKNFHQIHTPAAINEEKYVTVGFIVVEGALETLHAQNRHKCEHNLLIAEERLENF